MNWGEGEDNSMLMVKEMDIEMMEEVIRKMK